MRSDATTTTTIRLLAGLLLLNHAVIGITLPVLFDVALRSAAGMCVIGAAVIGGLICLGVILLPRITTPWFVPAGLCLLLAGLGLGLGLSVENLGALSMAELLWSLLTVVVVAGAANENKD